MVYLCLLTQLCSLLRQKSGDPKGSANWLKMTQLNQNAVSHETLWQESLHQFRVLKTVLSLLWMFVVWGPEPQTWAWSSSGALWSKKSLNKFLCIFNFYSNKWQQSAISFWFYRKEVEIIIYKFAASFPCIAYKITESEKDPGLTVSATKLTSIFCWQEQLTARKTNRRTGEFWQDKFIKDQFWSKFSCLFVPWCPIEGCNLLPLKICCPWKSHSNHPFCSVSIAHWHSCPIMLHDSSQTTLSALFAYSKKLLHRYTKPVQSFSNIHWKLILHAKMIWYAYYATPAWCCIQPGINQSIVTICIDSAMLC